VVTHWATVFADEVLAAAILDRLLHHSHTLMLGARATEALRNALDNAAASRTTRHVSTTKAAPCFLTNGKTRGS